jgi:hypothetical protein
MKIINEWDPIGLLNHAPQNEYDDEIHEIHNKYIDDLAALSVIIYSTFKNSFGRTFLNSINDCELIAKKIIIQYNNSIK